MDILGVDYVDVLLDARLKEVLDETDEESLEEDEPLEETDAQQEQKPTDSE